MKSAMRESISARAPGKIILSGEHAVVYDCPAIVSAVRQHIQCDLTQSDDFIFGFNADPIALPTALVESHLPVLLERIDAHQSGKLKIKEVIQNPLELYLLAYQRFCKITHIPLKPIAAEFSSTIPTGCGMGGSAAFITSILFALDGIYETKLDRKTLLTLAIETEHAVHGKSSGIDCMASQSGGTFMVEKGIRESLPLPKDSLVLIQTGNPESTTGECVEYAKSIIFPLCEKFKSVTQQFSKALKSGDSLNELIKQNHRLLCEIGVVPKNIQTLITEIESLGSAGKISGAGSINGEQAGMVIAVQHPSLHALCDKYNMTLSPFEGDSDGVKTF